ncbi:class I transcription factor A [Trypanosoma brucei equiperdum]|uniref:Class I transcription factor A n=1 Tax=Trypanosoma brucei equiperdum TaxID=630700 RepID=A0A3L6L0U1_9TRYP|nr:class I transcription factor A [Trypanosoma brucei equiperdum]
MSNEVESSAAEPPASDEATNVAGHRYILINNILCRTETSDGSFRPSDVFVGLDPPPRGTATLGSAAEDNCNHLSVGEFDPTAYVDSISKDCSIFNVFGVMSGGVLVDSESRGFIDFTDDMIFRPPLPPPVEGNDTHNEGSRDGQIRADGVVSLVSSIFPFNGLGTVDTPLPWPRSLPRLRSQRISYRLAAKTVHRMLSRCVGNVKCNKAVLVVLESYRIHRKLHSPQLTFLPNEIPFRFQWHGMTFRVKDGGAPKRFDANGNRTHEYRSPIGRINHMMDGKTGSAYSSFHAFTGLPKMAFRRYRESARRESRHRLENLADGYSRRLEMRIQNIVHPIREEMHIDENIEVVFRRRSGVHLWSAFQRYFTILGVSRCTSCNTPNCNAWYLDNDDKVDYPSALRKLEEDLKYRRTFNLSSSILADSWDWLLAKERGPLTERIRKIIKYARQIDAENKREVINTDKDLR